MHTSLQCNLRIKMKVYFDNAATTPISPEVIQAMLPYLENFHGNPSSIHAAGRKVRAAIEQSRKTVANCLNASIGEIFFTSGGTESSNMALRGAVRDFGVQRFISSPIEHPCVLKPLEQLCKEFDLPLDLVAVDHLGRPDFEDLERLLAMDKGKTLVSLMHANNELGTMLDLDRFAGICQQYGAFCHSDTVQTIGHFPIDVSQTKLNFLTGSAHKFHGPKGVGFIYINMDTPIKPLLEGGAQERNMRSGTENVYGIVGLAQALKMAVGEMDDRREHIEQLKAYMKNALLDNFEDIQFNGDQNGPALYTVLSVSFPKSVKSEMLVMNLDIAGICASGGSACSSGAETQSHVMQAIKADPDRKTIRFSFSHYNTKAEVDFVIGKLEAMVDRKNYVP